ncbi:uncharacterized protein LOC135476643 [Liolophura sinensis]|uniref:uncharacterized protein LOC135476643 n=1 Tax=Liolophura sinensis TaxID=3198878 RepID=UPI0031581599
MRLFTMETRSLGEDPPSKAFLAFEIGKYTETDADFRSVMYFDLDNKKVSFRSAPDQDGGFDGNGNRYSEFDVTNDKTGVERVGRGPHTPVEAKLLAQHTELQPVRYSETMTVSALPNYEERYVSTWLDVENKKRFNEKVHFKPTLAPVNYSASIICYRNSTRRRFLSQVEYEPRVRPRTFSEALFIYPKTAQTTYVSVMNYHVDECKRWFKSSVELKAKTYTTSRIQPEKPTPPRYSVTKTVTKQSRAVDETSGYVPHSMTNGPTDSHGRLSDRNMNESDFTSLEDSEC